MLIRDVVTKTVLIVENDVDLSLLIAMELREDGYESCQATTVAEAIHILDERPIHCIILDLSLVDNPYVLDAIEVLKFLRRRPDHIPVVIYTGYATAESISRIYDEFPGIVAGLVNKWTPEYQSQLRTAVNRAIESGTGINWNLELRLRDGLEIDQMISGLRAASGDSDELVELVGRAFGKPLRVDFLPLTPGFSGTGVVRGVPYIKAGTDRLLLGETIVFKYGNRSKIQQEVSNFRNYVNPFAKAHRRTSLVEEPAYTRAFGALQYALIGAGVEKITSFSEFYIQTYEIEQIQRILDNLFNDTCANWYSERERELAPPHKMYDADGLESRLRQWAERADPALLNSPTVAFPEVDQVFRNPLMLISEFGKSSRQVFRSIIHGDLNGSNILVDSLKAETWLIDFYQTGLGHLMKDFAKLETVMKFELLGNANIPTLYTAELHMLEPNRLEQPITFPAGQLPTDVEKMIKAVTILRGFAAQFTRPLSDAVQYYLALFYKTAEALTFEPFDNAKRRHVLLSLCLLGEYLHKARA